MSANTTVTSNPRSTAAAAAQWYPGASEKERIQRMLLDDDFWRHLGGDFDTMLAQMKIVARQYGLRMPNDEQVAQLRALLKPDARTHLPTPESGAMQTGGIPAPPGMSLSESDPAAAMGFANAMQGPGGRLGGMLGSMALNALGMGVMSPVLSLGRQIAPFAVRDAVYGPIQGPQQSEAFSSMGMPGDAQSGYSPAGAVEGGTNFGSASFAPGIEGMGGGGFFGSKTPPASGYAQSIADPGQRRTTDLTASGGINAQQIDAPYGPGWLQSGQDYLSGSRWGRMNPETQTYDWVPYAEMTYSPEGAYLPPVGADYVSWDAARGHGPA